MKIKLIFISLFFMHNLYAVTVQTNKEIYNINEKIEINVFAMFQDAQDWVAIYPKGSNNNWGNVLQWTYTNGVKDGKFVFNALPLGEYEARVFFQNSYSLEASSSFSVQNTIQVSTLQPQYPSDKIIQVKFSGMLGHIKDWIGIYPKGSSNDWENVVSWKWTNGLKSNKRLNFSTLPIGEYEVRAFFNNSYKLEAQYSFTVVSSLPLSATINTSKATYTPQESIHISFNNMSQDPKDWIAIYPKGSSTDWSNVVAWQWTNGQERNNNVDMGALPLGEYEVRAFFKNSFKIEAQQAFVVQVQNESNIFLDAFHERRVINYIVSGDSTRAIYFNKMKEKYQDIFAVAKLNLSWNAESGQSVYDWKNNLDQVTLQNAIDFTPNQGENTVLEFSWGINDYIPAQNLALQNNSSTKEVLKNWLREGIQLYKNAKPRTQIILVTPVYTAYEEVSTTLQQIYQELAIEFNLKLIDVVDVMKNAYHRNKFYQDYTHPNQYGSYRLLNHILNETLPLEVKQAITLKEPYRNPNNPPANNFNPSIQSGFYSKTTGRKIENSTWRSLSEIEVQADFMLQVEHQGKRREVIFLDAQRNFIVSNEITKSNGKTFIRIPSNAQFARINLSNDANTYEALNDNPIVKYLIGNDAIPTLSEINQGLNLDFKLP